MSKTEQNKLINEIDNISDKIAKLQTDIMSKDELSIYRGEELFNKLDSFLLRANILIDDCNELECKEKKRRNKRKILCIVFFIIGVLTTFFNPICSVFIHFFNCFGNEISEMKYRKFQTFRNDFIKKIEEISVSKDNCERFIKNRVDKKTKRLDHETNAILLNHSKTVYTNYLKSFLQDVDYSKNIDSIILDVLAREIHINVDELPMYLEMLNLKDADKELVLSRIKSSNVKKIN